MKPSVTGYEVDAELGVGAGATVWAAKDARGAPVAIKVLRSRDDDVATERLRREAEVLGALEHPGIVRLHGTGRTDDGFPYLVMERLPGGTLRERLADGPLDERAAWAIVRPIAEALAAAHAAGVLHRDLTSGNVLFDARGRPRLSDFGLAQRASDARLSRDGASTGTPAYMAPEQWWGSRVDERTDVYGLGGLLYEALTSVPPWHGEEPATLIHRVATGAPEAPSKRGAKLTPAADAFVQRCLSREPASRPLDVAAFLREGDAAFGARRIDAIEPWLWLAAVALAPIAMGYGGSPSPLAWIREAGWSGHGVLVGFAVGLGLAVRLPAARLLAPALPLGLGAAGFATGMQRVVQFVARLPEEERFAVFHFGVAEASASLFLGGALAAATLAWVAIREAPSGRAHLREVVLAGLALGAGLVAFDVGAALTAALAGALILRGAARRPASALAASGAVVAFGATAWIRVVGDASRVFDTLDRAARAAALTDAARDEVGVLGATAVAVVMLAGFARWRGARAWPRARLVVGGLGGLVVVLSLVLPWRSMQVARAELREALASHLGVWSDLDPPQGLGAAGARLGVTLQIGRREVSLDGARVVPVAALDSETGRLVLAGRLGARLALGRPPELVLAVDRATPWRRVAGVLAVAHELGARQVDLLLSTGAPLIASPSAPPEAGIVLPRDLRSLPIVLAADGRVFPEDASFAEVVDGLEAGARVDPR